MSVLINPEVFLYNAFFNKKEPYLTYKDLGRFATILETTITERSREKYVIMRLEESEIDDFLEKNDNFIRGIGKIHCKIIPTKEKIEELNSRYRIDIQKAFKIARVLNI